MPIDCDTNPTNACCANSSLYFVSLTSAAVGALLAAAMFFLLLRLPFMPTLWMRDPADVKRDADLHRGSAAPAAGHAGVGPVDYALSHQVSAVDFPVATTTPPAAMVQPFGAPSGVVTQRRT